jgi:hypothetical protein
VKENVDPLPEEAKKDHDFNFSWVGGYATIYKCAKCGMLCAVIREDCLHIYRYELGIFGYKNYYYVDECIVNLSCAEMMIKDIIE